MSYEELKIINLNEVTNKADYLFNQLSQMIIDKTLPENYTFPNENNMCQILSVGRGTIREVYKALELKGLITRSKAGTVVNDMSTIAENEAFDASLMISDKDSLIEFLLIVEPHAAALAAKKVTHDELKEIYDAMMKLEQANKELKIDDMNKYNSLFHKLIREATHNPILISSIYNSRKKYEELVVPPLMNDSPSSIEFMDLCLFQHYNLYYALKTHNEEKAEEIMYDHYMADINYYNNYIKELESEENNESSNI